MTQQIDLAPLSGPLAAIGEECRTFALSMWSQLPAACTDQQTADYCGQQAAWYATKRDEFIARRDGGLMPARQLLAWIESLFPADMIKVFDAAIMHLKSISFAYVVAERAKLQATLAIATTPQEVQRATAAAVVVPTGFVEKEKWGWELTDESKVPEDYWILDTDRLNREVKKMKARFAVPGIKAKLDTKFDRKARR